MVKDHPRFYTRSQWIAVTLMISSLPQICGCGAPRETAHIDTDEPSIVRPDVEAPTGSVVDLEGQSVNLLAAAADTGLVLIFLRTDCPVGNRYAPTISELHVRYAQQRLRFALVYPVGSESAANIRQHLNAYKLDIDAYRDPDRQLVSQVGASITPEAVVFDRKHRMVYRGRIDNRAIAPGKERPGATTHDLRDVLDAVVSGASLEFSTTDAVGCFIE